MGQRETRIILGHDYFAPEHSRPYRLLKGTEWVRKKKFYSRGGKKKKESIKPVNGAGNLVKGHF